MWDQDGSSHDQGHLHGFFDLLFVQACVKAGIDVIKDAIITSEHHGGHQSEQLFCGFGQGSIFITAMIQRKKAFSIQAGMFQNEFVLPLSLLLKLFFIHIKLRYSSATCSALTSTGLLSILRLFITSGTFWRINSFVIWISAFSLRDSNHSKKRSTL